MEDDEEELV